MTDFGRRLSERFLRTRGQLFNEHDASASECLRTALLLRDPHVAARVADGRMKIVAD